MRVGQLGYILSLGLRLIRAPAHQRSRASRLFISDPAGRIPAGNVLQRFLESDTQRESA
jgi:hypothetical protein